MNNRLIRLRKDFLKITQAEMAEKLNLSRAAICNYENGTRTVGERTLADICRVFDVNENWLRYGKGEPFVKLDADDEITDFLKELLSEDDNSIKKRFARAVARMTPQQWEMIERFINDLNEGI